MREVRRPLLGLKERIMIRRMVVNQSRVEEQEREGARIGEEIFNRRASERKDELK